MELNTLFAWSLAVNLCALLLLLEAFLLLRALLAAPQVLWQSLLFALFLGLSAWCFIGTIKVKHGKRLKCLHLFTLLIGSHQRYTFISEQ